MPHLIFHVPGFEPLLDQLPRGEVAHGLHQGGVPDVIEGAFDNIGHSALLQALGNFPARGLIKQWLKAGYVEDAMRHPTETGVPQGGVISPLLLNVALHGMEQALGSSYTPRGTLRGTYAVVRYADDRAKPKTAGLVG